MPNVTLGPLNTITVSAASGVYRLKTALGHMRILDVMNTGAGAIFVRGDLDPTVNDPNSLQIPSNFAVNGIVMDANSGLGIIAAADTTISVRAR